MEQSKLSVSQSLIKNWWSYKAGEYCGIALHKIDILKLAEKIPTERMQLGQYFEFLCTGAKLRDGSEPVMPQTKTGKPTAPATRMQEQAVRFNQLVEAENIKIDQVGVVLEHEVPDMNIKMKGVLDILGSVDGEDAIIDIKSSGLIGDEWKEYGWHHGTFNMRKMLTIQVVFYKWLARAVLGKEDMPFYFIVHSTTNDVDSLFWRIDIADYEVAMNHFEDMVAEFVDEVRMEQTYGFTPYPDVKRCGECPLYKECEFATATPKKRVVTIDGIFE